jgi:signal transduction histidine kinase
MGPVDALLSTLLALPDEERAAVERELIPLARAAALGGLAADVAHDVANPLFGVIGLVELLREDAPAGSEDAARLALLAHTTAEMKTTLASLLDFARLPVDDAGQASLQDASRAAIRLVRHGIGRTLELDERLPEQPVLVPCPPGLLVQAILQLLVAARSDGGLAIEIVERSLVLSPPPAESLSTRIAERIVTDHEGTVTRTGESLTVRWR